MPSPWARSLTAADPVEGMTRAEIRALYRVTLREGGATWNPGRGQIHLTDGYGMGAEAGTFRKVRKDDERSFIRAIRYLRRRHPGALIGTWLDGQHIHIDPALVFAGTLEEAAEEGNRRGQIAVYSFRTRTTHSITKEQTA